MEKILHLPLGTYRNEAIRTCGRCQILLQACVALFTILDDSTIVEVVLLATLPTGSNTTGVHDNRIIGTDGIVFPAYAIGTLYIVSHKTTIRLGIQNLEAHNDTIVDANHKLAVGLLFHRCLHLLA